MPAVNAGDTAPAGLYTCATCNNVLNHRGGTLPACSKCQGAAWTEPGLGSGGSETQKPVGSI
jgi:hypothetical protein